MELYWLNVMAPANLLLADLIPKQSLLSASRRDVQFAHLLPDIGTWICDVRQIHKEEACTMTFVDTPRSIKALMTRGGTSHLDAVARFEQNRLLCHFRDTRLAFR